LTVVEAYSLPTLNPADIGMWELTARLVLQDEKDAVQTTAESDPVYIAMLVLEDEGDAVEMTAMSAPCYWVVYE